MGKDAVVTNGQRDRRDKLSIRFGSLETSAQGTLAVVAIVLIVCLLAVFLREALEAQAGAHTGRPEDAIWSFAALPLARPLKTKIRP
jgi:hypothetical protein